MGGPKGNTTQRRCHVLGVGLADPRAELLVQLLLQPFPTLPASSWGPSLAQASVWPNSTYVSTSAALASTDQLRGMF